MLRYEEKWRGEREGGGFVWKKRRLRRRKAAGERKLDVGVRESSAAEWREQQIQRLSAWWDGCGAAVPQQTQQTTDGTLKDKAASR